MYLKLQKRFCLHPKYSAIIFTACLDAAPAYQCNTVKVNDCLRDMDFRTNYIQATKLNEKLNLLVSHDTLLRLIYKIPMPSQTSPFLVIDDFSFLKGDVYGAIVCYLRTNRPISLLNGHDFSTVTRSQPILYLIARVGSNTYKAAIIETSPMIVRGH